MRKVNLKRLSNNSTNIKITMMGFTLIELLAVIAILAIVMIIAVPTVLNTIATAKKGAFRDSVLGLLKSANNATVSDLDNMGEIDQFFVNDNRLNLDNKIFTSGIVIRINEKFRVFNVSNGEYCANGDSDNLEINQKNCEAKTTPETCFIFDKNSGGITGYKGITAECTDVVIIPNTIEGVLVTRIENNAFKSKGLTAVLLTNNITFVGDYAFANNKLTDNTYVVPNNSIYQGIGYFNNNALNQEAFTYLSGSNDTVIIGYAGTSKTISIPEGVVKIGDSAFRDLALTSIDFPSTLKEIGNLALYNNKLTNIDLKNVEKIGEYAFKVNQITNLTVPNTIKSIAREAFHTNKITNLVLPNGTISYGVGVYNNNLLPDNQAFIYKPGTTNYIISYGGAKKSGVVVPSGTVTIGDYSFYSCGLLSVSIPDGVNYITKYAFSNNSLATVTIPSTVTTLGASAFRNNKLTSINFGNINNITFDTRVFSGNQMPDDKAFIYDPKDSTRIVSYGGAKRSGIIIPNGVKTIGTYAFSANTLTDIVIPNTVTKIESGAFSENNLTDIILPTGLTSLGAYSFNQNSLPDNKAFFYDPANPTKLVSYGGINRTTITIPNNVKIIGTSSLSYTAVKNLIIPEGVTTIESSAAISNPLETVTIPSTVTSIGSGAFTPSSNTIRYVKIAGDPNRFNSIWTNIGFPTSVKPTN